MHVDIAHATNCHTIQNKVMFCRVVKNGDTNKQNKLFSQNDYFRKYITNGRLVAWDSSNDNGGGTIKKANC